MEDTAVKNKNITEKDQAEKKVHPWRLCPIGMHYVKEHQERIPPSKKHPNGEVITRHTHCANNPLGKNKKEIKDILSFEELQIIAKAKFSDLKSILIT